MKDLKKKWNKQKSSFDNTIKIIKTTPFGDVNLK